MEGLLIGEVAKYPILYDTSSEEYKHLEAKNNVWRQITLTLFNSNNPFIIERVKNKWKNLRDTFVKVLRKKDRPNAKPWKLEPQMKFLLPYINAKIFQREDISNTVFGRLLNESPENLSQDRPLDCVKVKREEDVEDVISLEENGHGSEENFDEELPPQKSGRRKRRRESSPDSILRHYLELNGASEQALEQAALMSGDSVDAFFVGLAQTVKRLKPVNQILLKKAIANLILDTELREMTEVGTCEASSSS